MNHFTPSFWDCYYKLSPEIQSLADKNYELLKSDNKYPSLHFKRINTYFSVRVGLKFRALGIELKKRPLVWIGNYAEYDKMLENN